MHNVQPSREDQEGRFILNKLMKLEVRAAVVLQFILGFLFIYSGLQKLSDTDTFLIIVKGYRLIPVSLTSLMAYVLPWIEFGLGSMLFLGLFIRFSALSLGSLLSVFIIAIAANLIRGIDFSCGCFSLDLAKNSAQKAVLWLARDAALLITCCIILYLERSSRIVAIREVK